MSLEFVVAGVILIALVVYLLSGGADFGGGIWDLLARGPRARAQRETIAHAIGPIWEANHVWLILVVVLLFVCFPLGFAAISTALHIPLTLMLMGIVLRGSAFVFRTYDHRADPTQSENAQRRWGRLFASASVISPLMLGVCAGAVASGALRLDPITKRVSVDFVSSWLAPFPFAIGVLTLALCAYTAAVYLAWESTDLELKEDFRLRALVSAGAVGVMAWVAFFLAQEGAPLVAHGLSGRAWSLPFQLLTGVIAISGIVALFRRWYGAARLLTMGLVGMILLGWGLSQFPYLIVPDLTFQQAAAPAEVLATTLMVLAVGSLLLVPAFVYLYVVFKGRNGHAQR